MDYITYTTCQVSTDIVVDFSKDVVYLLSHAFFHQPSTLYKYFLLNYSLHGSDLMIYHIPVLNFMDQVNLFSFIENIAYTPTIGIELSSILMKNVFFLDQLSMILRP